MPDPRNSHSHDPDELFVFARFHARKGCEAALAAALREVIEPTRAEPGNLYAQVFVSNNAPGLFYIHSRWRDEAAFEVHVELAHTRHFIACVRPLISHELDVARTSPAG